MEVIGNWTDLARGGSHFMSARVYVCLQITRAPVPIPCVQIRLTDPHSIGSILSLSLFQKTLEFLCTKGHIRKAKMAVQKLIDEPH